LYASVERSRDGPGIFSHRTISVDFWGTAAGGLKLAPKVARCPTRWPSKAPRPQAHPSYLRLSRRCCRSRRKVEIRTRHRIPGSLIGRCRSSLRSVWVALSVTAYCRAVSGQSCRRRFPIISGNRDSNRTTSLGSPRCIRNAPSHTCIPQLGVLSSGIPHGLFATSLKINGGVPCPITVNVVITAVQILLPLLV
jgi:hypothetical protein